MVIQKRFITKLDTDNTQKRNLEIRRQSVCRHLDRIDYVVVPTTDLLPEKAQTHWPSFGRLN